MPEVKDHGTDRCADIDRSKGRERKLKDAGNDEHAENSCQAVPVFLDDTVTALMDFVEAVPINDNKDAVEAEESRTSQVVIVDVVEIEEPGELRHAEEHKSDGCRRYWPTVKSRCLAPIHPRGKGRTCCRMKSSAHSSGAEARDVFPACHFQGSYASSGER